MRFTDNPEYKMDQLDKKLTGNIIQPLINVQCEEKPS